MVNFRAEEESIIYADFVVDSPATESFFRANLVYLGIKNTPTSHVD
jgi:hypothetical protein